ncbi:Phosphotransferase KptA/Tpt1 [Carpediemonas membranifera]|uniref:Phosphotransferase KptA/Tpt1 n=1 Tax=Carpediemonas membranifera TaxID=201153 RepID=A0A8J6B0A7_9EUKA|nr:Phosphotransferase KptA/Tpt1 [Carpediemonas membranifera]|eukprot:KAG9391504.1 Phosphotransferase KptA/Tpt1 [Carpediemonas membranifera]
MASIQGGRPLEHTRTASTTSTRNEYLVHCEDLASLKLLFRQLFSLRDFNFNAVVPLEKFRYLIDVRPEHIAVRIKSPFGNPPKKPPAGNRCGVCKINDHRELIRCKVCGVHVHPICEELAVWPKSGYICRRCESSGVLGNLQVRLPSDDPNRDVVPMLFDIMKKYYSGNVVLIATGRIHAAVMDGVSKSAGSKLTTELMQAVPQTPAAIAKRAGPGPKGTAPYASTRRLSTDETVSLAQIEADPKPQTDTNDSADTQLTTPMIAAPSRPSGFSKMPDNAHAPPSPSPRPSPARRRPTRPAASRPSTSAGMSSRFRQTLASSSVSSRPTLPAIEGATTATTATLFGGSRKTATRKPDIYDRMLQSRPSRLGTRRQPERPATSAGVEGMSRTGPDPLAPRSHSRSSRPSHGSTQPRAQSALNGADPASSSAQNRCLYEQYTTRATPAPKAASKPKHPVRPVPTAHGGPRAVSRLWAESPQPNSGNSSLSSTLNSSFSSKVTTLVQSGRPLSGNTVTRLAARAGSLSIADTPQPVPARDRDTLGMGRAGRPNQNVQTQPSTAPEAMTPTTAGIVADVVPPLVLLKKLTSSLRHFSDGLRPDVSGWVELNSVLKLPEFSLVRRTHVLTAIDSDPLHRIEFRTSGGSMQLRAVWGHRVAVDVDLPKPVHSVTKLPTALCALKTSAGWSRTCSNGAIGLGDKDKIALYDAAILTQLKSSGEVDLYDVIIFLDVQKLVVSGLKFSKVGPVFLTDGIRGTIPLDCVSKVVRVKGMRTLESNDYDPMLNSSVGGGDSSGRLGPGARPGSMGRPVSRMRRNSLPFNLVS